MVRTFLLWSSSPRCVMENKFSLDINLHMGPVPMKHCEKPLSYESITVKFCLGDHHADHMLLLYSLNDLFIYLF